MKNRINQALEALYRDHVKAFEATGELAAATPERHTVAEWEAMYNLALGLKLSAIERYNAIKLPRASLAITKCVGGFAGDAAQALRDKAEALDESAKWEYVASAIYENRALAGNLAQRGGLRLAA